jgi:predicted secreted protein
MGIRWLLVILLASMVSCTSSAAPTLSPTVVPAANRPATTAGSSSDPLPFDEIAPTEYMVQSSDLQRGILQIPAGQRFTLQLPQNVSTGYVWEIIEQDTTFLQLVVDTVELPDDAAVGSGGIRVLSFQAVTAGSTRLVLKHWRPWEGDAGTLATITLLVEVAAAAGGE